VAAADVETSAIGTEDPEETELGAELLESLDPVVSCVLLGRAESAAEDPPAQRVGDRSSDVANEEKLARDRGEGVQGGARDRALTWSGDVAR
jgi:hypothetical protein